jgi:hypothetical protein
MPLSVLFYRKGEAWLATASPSRLRTISFCLAASSFLLTQALHWLLYPLDSWDHLLRRMAADALAAVIIAFLVYGLLITLNHRRRETVLRLQLIADLNHHIRNALQTIQLSAQVTQDGAAIRQIDDAVERITDVLLELAPMDGHGAGTQVPQPRV